MEQDIAYAKVCHQPSFSLLACLMVHVSDCIPGERHIKYVVSALQQRQESYVSDTRTIKSIPLFQEQEKLQKQRIAISQGCQPVDLDLFIVFFISDRKAYLDRHISRSLVRLNRKNDRLVFAILFPVFPLSLKLHVQEQRYPVSI